MTLASGAPSVQSSDCLRVGPAGLVDAAVEVLKFRLRDSEGEGGDGVIHGFFLRFGFLLLNALCNQAAIDGSFTTVMPDGLIEGDQ